MLPAINDHFLYLRHRLKRLQLYRALLQSLDSLCICLYQMENIFPSVYAMTSILLNISIAPQSGPDIFRSPTKRQQHFSWPIQISSTPKQQILCDHSLCRYFASADLKLHGFLIEQSLLFPYPYQHRLTVSKF